FGPEAFESILQATPTVRDRLEASAREALARPAGQQGDLTRRLIEILREDLTAGSLTDVADATGWLRWTPGAQAGFPAAVAAALPRFDRAARFVGQSLALQSASMGQKALDDALTELGELRRVLASVPGPLAAQLSESAEAWARLIRAKRGGDAPA